MLNTTIAAEVQGRAVQTPVSWDFHVVPLRDLAIVRLFICPCSLMIKCKPAATSSRISCKAESRN